jgi:methyl-accepting chemotaxis protein
MEDRNAEAAQISMTEGAPSPANLSETLGKLAIITRGQMVKANAESDALYASARTTMFTTAAVALLMRLRCGGSACPWLQGRRGHVTAGGRAT